MSGDVEIDVELPLDRFTLRVAWSTGEPALGVFGASGSGKTSLLETLCGLRPAARGRIRVAGRIWLDSRIGVSLPPQRRGVGYVPQDARLFPHRTLLGNVLAGRRRAASAPHRADPARVLEVLELAGREGADVASLSGGERQRVALARAVCSGPDLLVLDEPLSGLDLPLRRRILPYLVRVQREFAVPSLYVSHDVTEVRLLSREAIVLQEGREVARGEPDRLFTRPDRIASLGAAEIENILHGTIVSQDGASARIDLGDGRFVLAPSAPGTKAPGRVSVLVRAEELIVAVEPPRGLSAQNVLSGTLTGLVDMHAGPGGDVGIALVVDVGPRQPAMIALVTEQACESLRLRTPMPVHLVWKTHACRMVPG